MEGQELKDGKERVRVNLIDPLVSRGMVRNRGQKVEGHQAMLDRLEARLAYMAADQLSALAEVVERYAGGAKKNVWPAEVSIINWARELQQPPASESRLVRSYLQSAAGDAALSGGYVVELFSFLKKYGAPPNGYSMKNIRSDADCNNRKRLRVERALEDGRADPQDVRWLQGYMALRQRCLGIIKAKQERTAV
ncbi:MAG: hypothetical protein CSA68_07380 [Rhodobacterales bacterium]|nr:MAG: hypothetical protein CSA68_07380 [Rhodobacterales bacterium]